VCARILQECSRGRPVSASGQHEKVSLGARKIVEICTLLPLFHLDDRGLGVCSLRSGLCMRNRVFAVCSPREVRDMGEEYWGDGTSTRPLSGLDCADEHVAPPPLWHPRPLWHPCRRCMVSSCVRAFVQACHTSSTSSESRSGRIALPRNRMREVCSNPHGVGAALLRVWSMCS